MRLSQQHVSVMFMNVWSFHDNIQRREYRTYFHFYQEMSNCKNSILRQPLAAHAQLFFNLLYGWPTNARKLIRMRHPNSHQITSHCWHPVSPHVEIVCLWDLSFIDTVRPLTAMIGIKLLTYVMSELVTSEMGMVLI